MISGNLSAPKPAPAPGVMLSTQEMVVVPGAAASQPIATSAIAPPDPPPPPAPPEPPAPDDALTPLAPPLPVLVCPDEAAPSLQPSVNKHAHKGITRASRSMPGCYQRARENTSQPGWKIGMKLAMIAKHTAVLAIIRPVPAKSIRRDRRSGAKIAAAESAAVTTSVSGMNHGASASAV